MVLTPDTPNEAFLREVDENLRRDQMESFARKYAIWIVLALILFLAAVGGFLYWQKYKQDRASAQSEQLIKIYNDIGAGHTDNAKKQLATLDNSGNGIVRSLALLTEAAIALDGDDRATALGKYRTLAGDSGVPKPYRDLALIRQTALEFDQMKPQDVVTRLAPLTKAGEPWFGSAGEMTAMAYLKEGNKAAAGKLFAAIAADKGTPATLRSRAAQIAGTLGIDASAELPQTLQQE